MSILYSMSFQQNCHDNIMVSETQKFHDSFKLEPILHRSCSFVNYDYGEIIICMSTLVFISLLANI